MTKKMKHRFILYPLLFVLALLIWDQIQFNSWKAEKIFYGKEQVIIDDPKDVHIAALTIYTNDKETAKKLDYKGSTIYRPSAVRMAQGWTMEKIKAYYKNQAKKYVKCTDEKNEKSGYLSCYWPTTRWILAHHVIVQYEPHQTDPETILITRVSIRPFAPY